MWMLVLALVGCDDTLFNGEPVETETISADWDGMQSLFLTECLACHGAGSPSGDLDLETDPCTDLVDVPGAHPAYGGDARVSAGDHQASILWHKLSDSGSYGGLMPPSRRLPASTADAVARWIDAGASCESETVDTGDVEAPTTAEVQSEVFDVRCVSCHSSPDPAGDLDLTDVSVAVGAASSYGEVLVVAGDAEGSFLYRKLRGTQGEDQGGRMPPGDGAIPLDDLVMVYEWIEGGAQ